MKPRRAGETPAEELAGQLPETGPARLFSARVTAVRR